MQIFREEIKIESFFKGQISIFPLQRKVSYLGAGRDVRGGATWKGGWLDVQGSQLNTPPSEAHCRLLTLEGLRSWCVGS